MPALAPYSPARRRWASLHGRGQLEPGTWLSSLPQSQALLASSPPPAFVIQGSGSPVISENGTLNPLSVCLTRTRNAGELEEMLR